MRRPPRGRGPNASYNCLGQPLMQRAFGCKPPVAHACLATWQPCPAGSQPGSSRTTAEAAQARHRLGPPPADAFVDARRDVHYTKPALRGWLHLLWFGVSLVVSTLLLARAHGATRIIASAIYAASVSGMFGASALYHRGSWSAAWRQRLQRLDHAMIFFLIAGTATPAFLLAV